MILNSQKKLKLGWQLFFLNHFTFILKLSLFAQFTQASSFLFQKQMNHFTATSKHAQWFCARIATNGTMKEIAQIINGMEWDVLDAENQQSKMLVVITYLAYVALIGATNVELDLLNQDTNAMIIWVKNMAVIGLKNIYFWFKISYKNKSA